MMANDKPTVLLEHYLKQLKLPTMLREHKAMAAACAKEGKNHTEFLLRLCERELLDREQRAAQRRIKAAKFPILKTLDNFDFKAQARAWQWRYSTTCVAWSSPPPLRR